MIPDGVLSTDPVPARFVGARSLPVTKTVDYEDGGIALLDSSEGLLYQRWRARLFRAGTENSVVKLSSPAVPEFDWIEEPNISEISFTFDSLMRPIVSYIQAGVAKMNWFDAVEGDYVTMTISGAITPRVTLDDKRFIASAGYSKSSVILAYVKSNNLYYRDQSERFDTEHLLAEDVKPLIKIGMNRQLRLQFMFEA